MTVVHGSDWFLYCILNGGRQSLSQNGYGAKYVAIQASLFCQESKQRDARRRHVRHILGCFGTLRVARRRQVRGGLGCPCTLRDAPRRQVRGIPSLHSSGRTTTAVCDGPDCLFPVRSGPDCRCMIRDARRRRVRGDPGGFSLYASGTHDGAMHVLTRRDGAIYASTWNTDDRCPSAGVWLRSGHLGPSVSGRVPALSFPTHLVYFCSDSPSWWCPKLCSQFPSSVRIRG